MNYLAFLLETAADGAGSTTTTPGALGGGMGFTWIIMIVMLVGMWWFTSRSQKKRDKEAQDMRDSLQVGDEVTTIGGIIGKVVSIKEETFVLETTKEKTHIRFLKGAIRSVDVRIADLTGATETPVQETPAEEQPKKFGFFKKNK
jgi:preprotein translocase subunit YajC